ncbi:Uncharacterised protein [Corynebacterium matruchotii]|uniref:hypothetical protein n=1 Tax=Corynebacterium matruchotii TaxID=43768 RepID=UPI000F6BB170|nr:hypothetical protein [Corynebacterium matruchotii]VEI99599.1 Uncharacterised protein [Corynebacterium matruchotii]
MNFRTALGVAVTIVMTSASLLIPATAGAQETTTEASAGQTATETPEKSTETTTASTSDTQDPNPDSKSDPNKDLQDLSNDLSNNKDKDKDGSSITYDDKGAIESVGSVTTDTLKFIGAIIKVLAGVAGLMVLLGKAFPAVKDLIHNIARGGHL